MKIKIFYILAFFLVTQTSVAQKTLLQLLEKYNNNSVPYLKVTELETCFNQVVILDAREKKEYQVSHLKNAIHVGFKNFSLNHTTKQLKNKEVQIVVYCSLGVRSEKIAIQLQEAGYTNVYNLYGGIFEWKNNNNPVYNLDKIETQDVHAYSKNWGTWLLKGNKIYSN
ncbi:MAG: rhodanese-like domain-containing protein [Oceanihabitans sp.]